MNITTIGLDLAKTNFTSSASTGILRKLKNAC
jgi:hypothetical protein